MSQSEGSPNSNDTPLPQSCKPFLCTRGQPDGPSAPVDTTADTQSSKRSGSLAELKATETSNAAVLESNVSTSRKSKQKHDRAYSQKTSSHHRLPQQPQASHPVRQSNLPDGGRQKRLSLKRVWSLPDEGFASHVLPVQPQRHNNSLTANQQQQQQQQQQQTTGGGVGCILDPEGLLGLGHATPPPPPSPPLASAVTRSAPRIEAGFANAYRTTELELSDTDFQASLNNTAHSEHTASDTDSFESLLSVRSEEESGTPEKAPASPPNKLPLDGTKTKNGRSRSKLREERFRTPSVQATNNSGPSEMVVTPTHTPVSPEQLVCPILRYLLGEWCEYFRTEN